MPSASHCLVYSLFRVHVVQREPPAASRVSIDQRGGLHSDGIVNKSHQESTANPAEHGPEPSDSSSSKGLTPQQLHHQAPINPANTLNLLEEVRLLEGGVQHSPN